VPNVHVLAFLLTVFVLIAIPGPSVLFVVSRGVTLGRRAALATVVGNAGGLAVQATLVAVGLGTLLARSVFLFTLLKLAGAAYLVVLGLRMLRNRGSLARVLDATVVPKATRRILREGFVVGATNPKGLLIFTAVLPQFVDRASGHVQLQLAALGAVCVLVALVSDSVWAVASGTARLWLSRSARRLELVGGAGGLAVIGLGLRLAATGRKD
jgi:threonine/homoserine/homoserine lactone efflux protein